MFVVLGGPSLGHVGPRVPMRAPTTSPSPSLDLRVIPHRVSVESPLLSLRTFTVNTPVSVCALIV